MISRASRIPIRSAGIDPPLGLPRGDPIRLTAAPANVDVTPGGIIPLWGARSSRKSGAGIIVEQVTQGGQAKLRSRRRSNLINWSS